ncbi:MULTISPECIES: restriction endonuclease [Stenotrophomonas]|uniref:restriction endonuclease n=1 Tax=Stenotrophomonas TaxID=40323 RepID=UPI0015EBE1F5|nr:restriction endonuclease [Stenotrophomonas maltophilia]
MDLPKPSNWQDFETITRDAFSQLWASPTLQKNGRGGQRQSGVDIYGNDYLGRPVGIQCKRYSAALTIKDVEDEIRAAEKFEGILTALFLATTGNHDSVLQRKVRTLSESRARSGDFAVGILFWEDVVRGLVLNPSVLKAHYPQIVVSDATTTTDRLLAALELGYFGAHAYDYMNLIYGEYGWLAQEDPDNFVAKMQVVSRHCEFLLSPNDAGPIVECIGDMLTALPADDRRQDTDWNLAAHCARRAATRIANVKSLLIGAEAKCLDVGMELGRVYHHIDDFPSQHIAARIDMKLRSVIGGAAKSTLDDEFANALTLRTGYQWAQRIYVVAQREIRYQGAR